MIGGMKGCGGCHKIGVKDEKEGEDLAKAGLRYGRASCDACHTRHTFSAKEARQPQACQTCHEGSDYPQWATYTSSKHGVRHLLKQLGVMPAGSPAPACQDCHMQGGDHEVRSADAACEWLLPMPEEKEWATDRVTILQSLGFLDPDGKPTARSAPPEATRLGVEARKAERERITRVCEQCHSRGFARGEMEKGDQSVRDADHLMAQGIRVVAALYRDGVLRKPASYASAFPDVLAFHHAPTPIELRLWEMFLRHRVTAIQGTFHASPNHAFWDGWSAMRTDLTEIEAMAEELRKGHRLAKN
jgi:hypothetical protein